VAELTGLIITLAARNLEMFRADLGRTSASDYTLL
jgi:hypothetical protein